MTKGETLLAELERVIQDGSRDAVNEYLGDVEYRDFLTAIIEYKKKHSNKGAIIVAIAKLQELL